MSLFTSLRCQPNVHGRSTPASSGWDRISSYPQNPINVVTRPLPQVSRSCEMINVAWARFQAEDIDSYQTRPAVRSSFLNVRLVQEELFDQNNILALRDVSDLVSHFLRTISEYGWGRKGRLGLSLVHARQPSEHPIDIGAKKGRPLHFWT